MTGQGSLLPCLDDDDKHDDGDDILGGQLVIDRDKDNNVITITYLLCPQIRKILKMWGNYFEPSFH